MKRIEVFISGRDGDRRLGTLEYDELRGKEVSSFELDEDFVLSPSVSFLGPELWRRMAFSLLVSNTDDHLRNHGFVSEKGRWRLSPAYDLNANVKRPHSLSLELDAGVPIESVDTLLDAAEYFRLGRKEANAQIEHIRSAVGKWRDVAVRLGIPRREQEEMSVCFTRH